MALEPAEARRVCEVIAAAQAESGASVLLVAVELRRALRRLIELDLFDLAVMSFHELQPDLRLDTTARIGEIEPLREVSHAA